MSIEKIDGFDVAFTAEKADYFAEERTELNACAEETLCPDVTKAAEAIKQKYEPMREQLQVEITQLIDDLKDPAKPKVDTDKLLELYTLCKAGADELIESYGLDPNESPLFDLFQTITNITDTEKILNSFRVLKRGQQAGRTDKYFTDTLNNKTNDLQTELNYLNLIFTKTSKYGLYIESRPRATSFMNKKQKKQLDEEWVTYDDNNCSVAAIKDLYDYKGVQVTSEELMDLYREANIGIIGTMPWNIEDVIAVITNNQTCDINIDHKHFDGEGSTEQCIDACEAYIQGNVPCIIKLATGLFSQHYVNIRSVRKDPQGNVEGYFTSDEKYMTKDQFRALSIGTYTGWPLTVWTIDGIKP